MSKLAIIYGYNNLNFNNRSYLGISKNKYGVPSSAVSLATIDDYEIFLLNRHNHDFKYPPHLINYKANIFALKELGVNSIISINTVGIISSNYEFTKLFLPNQIIDYTNRDSSFVDDPFSIDNFIDFYLPFDNKLYKKIRKLLSNNIYNDITYGVTQGPRMETKSELNKMQNDGCDIVGMTLMPECLLAKQLSINFASICVPVNKPGTPMSKEDIQLYRSSGYKKIEEFIISNIKQLI